MKSMIMQPHKQVNNFPVMMIHVEDLHRPDPLIYLFLDENRGIVIHDNEGGIRIIGELHTNLDFDSFERYAGELVLSN